MFNLFKQDKESIPQDVKAIRERLLQFIKELLGKVEGGEGNNIKGIHLYFAVSEEEKHLYESAVYFDEVGKFKDDVQKIADDFAIDLPDNWAMDINFVEALPSDAIKVPDLAVAVFIQTRKRAIQKTATAYLVVLNGEAEKEVYTITSSSGKINIGRDKNVQSGDGFFRINHIAFPAGSQHESNKFISRQHAHITFDNETGEFILFADEGGIPPRNKIKVRSVKDAVPIKLHSTQIGHHLQEGDQIALGESALLAFSYSKDQF